MHDLYIGDQFSVCACSFANSLVIVIRNTEDMIMSLYTSESLALV